MRVEIWWILLLYNIDVGINPDNKNLNWVEWRGVSYAGGGDPGAITMPNVRARRVSRNSSLQKFSGIAIEALQ